jgi:hypothetical protein
VAAAPGLFLSSVSSGALDRQLAPLCRGTSIDPNASRAPAQPLEIATQRVGGFEPVVHTLVSSGSQFHRLQAGANGASIAIVVGSRTGLAQHLRAIGAMAGDIVTFGVDDKAAPQHVVGVYPRFVNHGFDSFWCPLRGTLGTNTPSTTASGGRSC